MEGKELQEGLLKNAQGIEFYKHASCRRASCSEIDTLAREVIYQTRKLHALSVTVSTTQQAIAYSWFPWSKYNPFKSI